jgi:hypothetical protein
MRGASERSSESAISDVLIRSLARKTDEEDGKVDRRIRPAKLCREAKECRLTGRLATNRATRGRFCKPSAFALRSARPGSFFADGPKTDSAKGVGCTPGWMFG